MSDNSSASAIEVNGVNPVPDSRTLRHARRALSHLFSWNISIFGITLGIYVLGLGLSVWQAMLAGVIGYFVSCALVASSPWVPYARGCPRSCSRASRSATTQQDPDLLRLRGNMGWKVTMLSMASTTLADLMCHLVPVLAQVDGSPRPPASSAPSSS